MEYPFWIGTVGEAISMIGYERNTDRIIGSCYVRFNPRPAGQRSRASLLMINKGPYPPQPRPMAMGRHHDPLRC
jgi:hypothetical protein